MSRRHFAVDSMCRFFQERTNFKIERIKVSGLNNGDSGKIAQKELVEMLKNDFIFNHFPGQNILKVLIN